MILASIPATLTDGGDWSGFLLHLERRGALAAIDVHLRVTNRQEVACVLEASDLGRRGRRPPRGVAQALEPDVLEQTTGP